MFQNWIDRFTEMLRGSSREPDDLALGTTRPGDFIEPQEGEELILPNPHDEDDRAGDAMDAALEQKRGTQT